jgi:hypothetical protein
MAGIKSENLFVEYLMFRRTLGLALISLSIVAAAPATMGPPWISIEYPPSPYDASTRDAFLLVHTFHHGTPVVAPIAGTAEGIVSGERRTVSLKFGGTSRSGVYALKKQWPSEGTWVLFITASQGPNDDVTAVVELGTSGQVASVRVPTTRRGSWDIPADVSRSDRESILRARFAANTGERPAVAGRTP